MCVYKVAPIVKNRYVFTSFNGHYSDNTKAISIKLKEMDDSAEIIWLVDSAYSQNLPEYAKVVNINSIKAYWYRGTAAAQIDNVYGFRARFKTSNSKISNFKIALASFLSNKRRQPIFATMQGRLTFFESKNYH